MLLRHPDAAEKAPFLAGDRANLGTEAADQVNPLPAHPVRHEDRDRVAERPADAGDRDAGVAAGSLDDRSARLEHAPLVATPDDVQRHAVLDAAGHVQVLGLGVDRAGLAAKLALDREDRRVADQVAERPDPPLPKTLHPFDYPIAGGCAFRLTRSASAIFANPNAGASSEFRSHPGALGGADRRAPQLRGDRPPPEPLARRDPAARGGGHLRAVDAAAQRDRRRPHHLHRLPPSLRPGPPHLGRQSRGTQRRRRAPRAAADARRHPRRRRLRPPHDRRHDRRDAAPGLPARRASTSWASRARSRPGSSSTSTPASTRRPRSASTSR